MNPSSKRVASRWLASFVEPTRDELKLVRAFLDDMKHGLHLAEMLDARDLVKVFKRIQKEANAVLDIADKARPGITLSNGTLKWKGAVLRFRKEWDSLFDYAWQISDGGTSGKAYNRIPEVLTPLGLRPKHRSGFDAGWFYDWVGRRQP